MSKDTTNPIAPRANSMVDDVAAAVGFTAALRLCAWFGGKHNSLYVPATASPEHPIALLIGMPAFQRLVEEWGSQWVALPTLEWYEEDCRNRVLRDLLAAGVKTNLISRTTNLSYRRVQQLRTHFEESGLLAMILQATAEAEEPVPENAG